MVSSKTKQIYPLLVYLFWIENPLFTDVWLLKLGDLAGDTENEDLPLLYFKILWNSSETVSARTIEQMNPHPNGQWGLMGNDSRHCGIHILSDLCATCDTVKDLFNLTLDLQNQCYGSVPTLPFPTISNSLCHCSKFVCDFVWLCLFFHERRSFCEGSGSSITHPLGMQFETVLLSVPAIWDTSVSSLEADVYPLKSICRRMLPKKENQDKKWMNHEGFITLILLEYFAVRLVP